MTTLIGYLIILYIGDTMDINSFLNNFLGTNNQNPAEAANPSSESTLIQKAKELATKANNSGVTSFAGGAAAGGLLTLLLSNHKVRNVAGSALSYGGVALIGALAHKAYQNYQSNRDANLNAASQTDLISQTKQQSNDFTLTLIKAMIAAAKSDGHLDSNEQSKIFSAIEKMQLPSEQKSLIFDFLSKPITMNDLTSDVQSTEQAAELYLASCMVIEIDHPEEDRYLNDLAIHLKLPKELTDSLHTQVKEFKS